MHPVTGSIVAVAAAMPGTADTLSFGDDDAFDALEVLETIPVENEHRNGFDRDLFGGWLDEDGDGCDTRDEVLRRDSLTPPDIFDGCELTGEWRSAYDDVTTSDAREIEIDHVVSLKEAWDSGGGRGMTRGGSPSPTISTTTAP